MNKPTKPAGNGRKPIKTSQENIPPRDVHTLFPIVGIGASAGGLEALEQFLRHVPQGTGMAFVIVQHLDPTHKGIMPELLQRTTKMEVFQVKDRMKVKPDSVYVIPPNKDMSILHGVLHLFDPAAPRGLRLPIDFFLRSLAEDRLDASIGVILSGMGSDGTMGLRAIKERAGVVACAGACLGQVRQHAQECHRSRTGRPCGSCRGFARQDHRISPTLPQHRQDRSHHRGEGSERPGEDPDPAQGQDRPRLLVVQEEHRLPPDRAAHGHSPDRSDRCLCPLSPGKSPGSGTPFQGTPDRRDQFLPRSGGMGTIAGRSFSATPGGPPGRRDAAGLVGRLLHR